MNEDAAVSRRIDKLLHGLFVSAKLGASFQAVLFWASERTVKRRINTIWAAITVFLDGPVRKLIPQHWIHWCAHLVGAIACGVLVIPFFRVWPESVHKFARGLADWQRMLLTFLACLLVVHLLFQLFSPRIRHLKYWRYPPIWSAWLSAFGVVAACDLIGGLSPATYKACLGDWAGYGVGSIAAIAVFRWLATSDSDGNGKSQSDGVEAGKAPDGQPSQPASEWDRDAIKRWLESEAPADRQNDIVGNYHVAVRIKRLLESKDSKLRSIGIVGPFGAGKTTIVRWLVGLVAGGSKESAPRLLISEHSCWNFETSALSIHAMLADAIEQVGQYIDTYYVRSLPESYRAVFSSGGGWLGGLSSLLFRSRDPVAQFGQLSGLLSVMDARLIFVVEDLDRNESRTFDIQEVQSFLYQIKRFPNLSFVLTGGASSFGRIDFPKLCDHIEDLGGVDRTVASAFVQAAWQLCSDRTKFPYKSLGATDGQQLWDDVSSLLLHRLEGESLPHAVAELLRTPRSLRHVLSRTCRVWEDLCGEINWNHLLAVNVLRFAAPECFSFLRRHQEWLCSDPEAHAQTFRDSVASDWARSVEKVEWDVEAARVVLRSIFPESDAWLDGGAGGCRGNPLQGVKEGRYWRRAVNGVIDPRDVPDQRVLSDLDQWLQNPTCDAEMISQLCQSSVYGEVWEKWASLEMASWPGQVLLLCQHVLSRICQEYGAAACEDSQGFAASWKLAKEWAPRVAENRAWLEERIGEAAGTSLALVNALWQFYGASGDEAVLRRGDVTAVRKARSAIVRNRIDDAATFERVLHPSRRGTLYALVFDPDVDSLEPLGTVSDWKWLAPIVIDSLSRGSLQTATEVAWLLIGRYSDRRGKSWEVDEECLSVFFGEDAIKVIGLLEKLGSQMGESGDCRIVKSVAYMANVVLSRGGEGV